MIERTKEDLRSIAYDMDELVNAAKDLALAEHHGYSDEDIYERVDRLNSARNAIFAHIGGCESLMEDEDDDY